MCPDEVLRAAAKQMRLRARGDRAAGRIDGLAVELRYASPPRLGRMAATPELEVSIGGPAIAPLLALENRGERWAVTIAGTAPTLDRAFDAHFAVAGPEDVVLAALDHTTRSLLVRAVDFGERARVRLTASVLRFRAAIEPAPVGALRIDPVVRHLVEIARRLGTEGTFLPARILENAAREPCSALRHRALRGLVDRHAECDEAREALALSAIDRDPEMRLFAGRRLGRDGLDVLRAVIGSRSAAADTRITALGDLIVRFPAREVIPILARTALHAPKAVQLVALEYLGSLKASEAVPKLAPLARVKDAEVVIALLRALATIGGGDAEPIVIAALERDEPEVQIVAADALVWCGNAAALEALFALGQRTRDPKLAARIEETVVRIRARIGPAEGGRLSIAAADDVRGALSVNDAPGALSVSRDLH